MRRRQTQRVEARIVQIGRVAEPPNGFLCRELRVDRRVGRTAQSAPTRGKAPVVRQFPARHQVDDVAGVPRGGLILPLQIGKFAAEERDRGRSRQALRQSEPRDGFRSVGASPPRRNHRFIAQHRVGGALAGKAHALKNGDGVVAIGLVEAFDCERKALIRLIVHTHHAVVGDEVFECLAVGEIARRRFVAHGRVGGPLCVASHVGAQLRFVIEGIGEREARGDLREGVAHRPIVGVAHQIHPEGSLQTLLPPRFGGLCKGRIGEEVQVAFVVVDRRHARFDAIALRAVEIMGVLHAGTDVEFERQRPEGAFETQLVFRLLRPVVKEFRQARVVSGVFVAAVVEEIAAQYPAVGVRRGGHFVDRPQGVVPLVVGGQDVQQKAPDLLRLFVQLCVEAHVVDGGQTDDGQATMRADAVIVFELKVIVGGQEGEFEPLVEHFQIGPARRNDERRARVDRPVEGDGSVGSPERNLRVQAVAASFFHANVHHRTQRVGAVGRKSPRVEVHRAHKVGV